MPRQLSEVRERRSRGHAVTSISLDSMEEAILSG